MSTHQKSNSSHSTLTHLTTGFVGSPLLMMSLLFSATVAPSVQAFATESSSSTVKAEKQLTESEQVREKMLRGIATSQQEVSREVKVRRELLKERVGNLEDRTR